MAVLNTELPFFFDQPRRSRIKRKRKSLEHLPFSLPFTGVSGTVKVEAYLKQQLKISEQSTKEALGESQETDPNGETQNGVSDKDKVAIPSSSQSKMREDLESPKKSVDSRKEKVFLPSDANPSRDFYDEEEDEDTQRFLFQENKFGAPNLLAQLGRLLEYFYEKQQEKMDGPVRDKNSNNWANLTSNNLNNTLINLGTSHINIRALDVPVPFHLKEKLKWNFNQLIASVVYSKREWQTTSYKQLAASSQRDVGDESAVRDLSSNISSSKLNLSKQDNLPVSKKLRKPHDEQISSQHLPETSQNMAKRGSSLSTSTLMDEAIPEVPTSVMGFRRESSKPNVGYTAPRTRLEKYKYLPDKTTLLVPFRRRKKSTSAQQTKVKQETEQEGAEKGKELINIINNFEQVSGQVQPPLTSITFSLMSKTCEDQGWVNYESQKDDLERITIIEWAHSRLEEAINSRTDCALKAKERGEDGPLIVRQYGDSRGDLANKLFRKSEYDSDFLKQLKEAKLDIVRPTKKGEDVPVTIKQYRETGSGKPKKGKSKVKRTPSGTAKLELFVIILPDETMTLYYPSGKMAVCVAKNVTGKGKYTYVYDEDNEGSLIAYFTPSSACVYDKDRKKFLCTSKEGTIYDKGGEILRKWSWKISKLLPAVMLELNRYLTFKIVSRSVMTLYYNAKRESFKFMVGVTQDGPSLQLNDVGEVMTSVPYVSETAPQPAIKPKPRNKREERKARGQKISQPDKPVSNEELLEQRKEELDKKFPERKKLALDLHSDVELYKLKRRIKNITFEWMESYRLLVGISPPIKVPSKQRRRHQLSSAKSLPGALPSSQEALRKLDHVMSNLDQRAPSAPPIPRDENVDTNKVKALERLHSLAEGLKEPGQDRLGGDKKGVVPVHFTEVEKLRFMTGSTSPRPPFRCGLAKNEPRSCPPKEGCPVAMRAEILGEKYPCCRCRKRAIPFVSDIEYDIFIREHVPSTQLLVVSIVSSRRPDDTPCISMLEQLYYEKNRNRSFPCAQARNDPFRIVLYDVDRSLKIEELLLVKRHNVVPGMFLMYIGGKLLFADHIFNGYGNARQDFLKQITKSRKDYVQGLYLPLDFRLSPTPCRSGLRAAWGGEIGGLSRRGCHNEAEMVRNTETPVEGRLTSAVTSASSDSVVIRADGAKSAASFINLGLSIDSPFSRRVKRKLTVPVRKTAPQSRA